MAEPRQDAALIERAQLNFARSRIGGWLAVNVAMHIDRRLIRATRGRVSLFVGAPVGLLETTGARSGKRRRTPLLYVQDDERVLLTASKAGAPRHPGWFHNLRANPDVGFSGRDGADRRYRARVADGAERDELWRKVNELYPGYDTYQERTGGRRIPVVVLEPAD